MFLHTVTKKAFSLALKINLNFDLILKCNTIILFQRKRIILETKINTIRVSTSTGSVGESFLLIPAFRNGVFPLPRLKNGKFFTFHVRKQNTQHSCYFILKSSKQYFNNIIITRYKR